MLGSRILRSPARPTTLGMDSVAPYVGLYEPIGITERAHDANGHVPPTERAHGGETAGTSDETTIAINDNRVQ